MRLKLHNYISDASYLSLCTSTGPCCGKVAVQLVSYQTRTHVGAVGKRWNGNFTSSNLDLSDLACSSYDKKKSFSLTSMGERLDFNLAAVWINVRPSTYVDRRWS